MTPAAEFALGLAQERAEQSRDADAEREARPGAALKFSACTCTDGTHGYPDRLGWVKDSTDAQDDMGASGALSGHVIERITREI